MVGINDSLGTCSSGSEHPLASDLDLLRRYRSFHPSYPYHRGTAASRYPRACSQYRTLDPSLHLLSQNMWWNKVPRWLKTLMSTSLQIRGKLSPNKLLTVTQMTSDSLGLLNQASFQFSKVTLALGPQFHTLQLDHPSSCCDHQKEAHPMA
jgi:hypothetical protein